MLIRISGIPRRVAVSRPVRGPNQGIALLIWAGRRLRLADPGDRLGKVLAVVTLALTVPLQILYFTPGYWDLQKTLPIQLCDLASFVAVYALWTHKRWAVGLVDYWGLTLTTQAIITPDLAAAFPDPVFLLYWGMHLIIVWAAFYLVWGRGVTPNWHTYGVAVAVTAVWAVTIYAFNVVVGTNYGYLNAKPNAASILDVLGPWPGYVLAEIAVIVAVWALATWPWTSRRRSANASRQWQTEEIQAGRGARLRGHQSRQNSLPSTSCITRHDSLWSSASNSRTRTAPSGTSRAHSASRAARRSSPTSPVPTRTSRCSRFLTTLPSGTRWKNSRGPTPEGSTQANAEP